MHHARLENILEKLIVVDGPACLDFKYPVLSDRVSVSVEALLDLAFASEKHGDNDFVIAGLPFLDKKAHSFQSWPESGHNRIAGLVRSLG
jgi:hypothetical protein